MTRPIPDGFECLSSGPRQFAEDAVDRTLRTTHDAIRFTAALAQALGDLGYECTWVKPDGSRRLYARDADRPGWIVAQPVLELSLDVPAPPPWANQVQLPDGSLMELPRGPRPQPEGPDQRSGELRLIAGERVAQWAYDESGQVRERARGRGDGPHDSDLPFLREVALLEPSPQQPHDLFLVDDLDPDGHSAGELAARMAALDLGRHSAVRVRVPFPMPGGPALAARRAVGELRKASFEGRWSYPGTGWVVLDGYLAEVKATGATLEAAVAEWERAMALHNPVPRDSRVTQAQIDAAERRLERLLDEEGEGGPQFARDADGRLSMRAVIRFVPPREMPFPPHRSELAPAVAIPLPPPPELPAAWRAAGFTRVVRLLDESGHFAHGFHAAQPDGGFLFVGEEAARAVDPADLRARLAILDEEGERAFLESFGGKLPGPARSYPWTTSEFSVLGNGRSVGPLRRSGSAQTEELPSGGYEPPARWMVIWSRPA